MKDAERTYVTPTRSLKMSTHSTFFRSMDSFNRFDGDSGSSDDGDGEDEAVAAETSHEMCLPQSSLDVSTRLFSAALLEHLCNLYIPDHKQSHKLFKVLCTHLTKQNMMPPLSGADELGTVRAQYKISFSKLIEAAMATINQERPLGIPPSSRFAAQAFFHSSTALDQLKLNLSDIIGFHTSRYRDEYDEDDVIGRGAYGSVYQVQHRLDGMAYAIKKVAFHFGKAELWFKVLREVGCLASLSHPNIVRYYTAWLEYHQPNRMATDRVTTAQDDFSLPPVHHQHSTSAATKGAIVPYQNGSSSSSSNRVVFQSSTRAKYRRYVSWDQNSSREASHQRERESSCTDASSASPTSRLIEQSCVVLHIQMELCTQTLKDWIADRNGKLTDGQGAYEVVDEELNLHIIEQLLKAVDYIHSHDLIHRDIKPKNIFLQLGPDGGAVVVKVGDFGLARDLKVAAQCGDQKTPLTPHPGFPSTGCGYPLDVDAHLLTGGVGTTIYASPEQLTGDAYDHKSDTYSVGLVLYELYQPFRTEMERVHCLEDLRRGSVPDEFTTRWRVLGQLIRDLLDVCPAHRPTAKDLLTSEIFQSKDQVIEQLRQTLRQKDERIAQQDERISQQDEKIAQQDKRIAQQDKRIAQLEELLR